MEASESNKKTNNHFIAVGWLAPRLHACRTLAKMSDNKSITPIHSNCYGE